MKRIFLFSAIFFCFLGCKENRKPIPDYTSESVEKLLSIDDILKVEEIIENPAFEEAAGDTAWHRINKEIVRIKIGKKYYLRQETREGYTVDYTYRYE